MEPILVLAHTEEDGTLGKPALEAPDERVAQSSQEMARPFAAPPGLPADRRTALIAAFDETMRDRGFLAEAKMQDLDVAPVSARDIDAMLAEVYATPKSVTDKAAKATMSE